MNEIDLSQCHICGGYDEFDTFSKFKTPICKCYDVEDDEDEEVCHICGRQDFSFDRQAWDRICRNCGVVSLFDLSMREDLTTKFRTYFKSNYFSNTIVPRAMTAGLKMTWNQRHTLLHRFKLCETGFNLSKKKHERKYFPNYNFVLIKICQSIGIENSEKYIKLPKLNCTLIRVKKDWLSIIPEMISRDLLLHGYALD